MSLTDLDAFVRVVDTQSFTKAAAQLGVPKSTVSRRVARLEDALGAELLARKARSFTITTHGRLLHARCGPALEEIALAERSLTDEANEPAGVVRLTATNDFGTSAWFSAFLIDFRLHWPRITLDVELTSRRVDLVEEGFDVAFRAHKGRLQDSTTLTAHRLLSGSTAVYASADYLERTGPIRSPKALAGRDCLTLRAADQSGWWLQRAGSTRPELFPIRRVMASNDFSLVLSAAVRGAGIALLPRLFAEPHLERGELVRVLSRWSAISGGFSLVWPLSRHPPPRVRAFIDFAREAFATHPSAKQ